ncbi:hypothetical protein CPC08DRAFT_820417 [Agrocybe pediades]|nr:hypothetical protein CPC08DRAFT_820417 [Agrocybe pediades]
MDLASAKAKGHKPQIEPISHTGRAKKDKSKNYGSDPYHKRPTSQKPAPEFSIHSTDFQREGQTELDTAFALHAAGTSTEMQSIWEKGEKAFRELERQFDPQASSRRFRTPVAAQDAVNAPSTGAGRLTGLSLPMLSTSSRPCSRMDVRAARSLDNSSQTQHYQEAAPQSQRPDQHTLLPAPIPALQSRPSFYAPDGLYVPVGLKRGEFSYIASSLSPGDLSDLSHAIDELEREHVVLKEQKEALEERNYILFKQIEELKRVNGTLGTQKAHLEANHTQTQLRTETRGIQQLDDANSTWKCANIYHDLVEEIERYKTSLQWQTRNWKYKRKPSRNFADKFVSWSRGRSEHILSHEKKTESHPR